MSFMIESQMLRDMFAPRQCLDASVVNIYDFDGVIASPFEEALFQMPVGIHDQEFIQIMSESLGVDLSGESLRSARYICIQGWLWERDAMITQGPMFQKLEGPYHIMTARCDRFASARLHEFLDVNMMTPIKIFQLDQMPKGQMLEVLLERHPDTCFRFYDDTMKHISSARLLRNPRLEVFHVDNDMEPHYVAASTFYKQSILESVL